MNRNRRIIPRVKVSADGEGVVSHAGVGMLREVAEGTGLSEELTRVLGPTYKGPWLHDPGRVVTDLACAIADGADAVTGIEVLGDREELFGPVASMPTTWRVLEKMTGPRLHQARIARAAARERAWAAGAGPKRGEDLHLDFDATIVISHSEKEDARATWKKTFGFHPLLVFLDRPEVSDGEALAGMLRPGNAGSNTAADHVKVLHQALEQLPKHARPVPGDPASQRVVARSDTAGATHVFADACREAGVEFSFGFPIDWRIHRIVDLIPQQCWDPALDSGEGLREGAWVAEATDMIDLWNWPEGSRLILRKERPHPGAQLTFWDADGMRITGFLTDTPPRRVPGQTAGLELRHRQHARIEDRIRGAKATGLRNLPCRGWEENLAWLQAVLIAADLVTWTKLLAFADIPSLGKVEIATFRYRVLHVAARLTRGGRQLRLRIDKAWRWANDIAQGWHRIRLAFDPG